MKRRSFLKHSAMAFGATFFASRPGFSRTGNAPASLLFDTADHGRPPVDVPVVKPWRAIELDPDYGGFWVVAGDVDGDGEVEIVSAQNFNKDDVHYTSAAACQKLDGTVLWRWGNPEIGRRTLHHDVACQIHDWDGDGRAEVVLLTKGMLIALDGATGEEKQRFPIPEQAADCLVFCDLSGKGRPEEVLVKDRYRNIWAYNRQGEQLWTVLGPGGHRTAHQPRPMDINGDGREEIFAGFAMLNPDGSERWVLRDMEGLSGHLDCARIVRRGATPEAFRIAITCCGGNNIAMVDGNGALVWEHPGHHFESIQVGRIIPGRDSFQLLVDIDHRAQGEAPLWVFDEDGTHLGRIMTDSCRLHNLVDWTGNGCHDIVVGDMRGLYDHRGMRIALFDDPRANDAVFTHLGQGASGVHVGDMTGNGIPDIMLNSHTMAYIYRNENGIRPETPPPLGTGLNVTLY